MYGCQIIDIALNTQVLLFGSISANACRRKECKQTLVCQYFLVLRVCICDSGFFFSSFKTFRNEEKYSTHGNF